MDIDISIQGASNGYIIELTAGNVFHTYVALNEADVAKYVLRHLKEQAKKEADRAKEKQ